MNRVASKPWALLAPALALVLLAAHFYRAAAWPLLLLTVALLPLLALRRPWVPRLLQWALLAAAAEWLWTAAMLAQQRLALGQPWQRMTFILGGVALLTLASAAVFRGVGPRRHYQGD